MSILRSFLCLALFAAVSHSEATDYFFDKDKSLKQGHLIYIIAYDRRLGGVFEVQTTEDKRQKNHYTRLGDLSLAASKVDRNKHKRRPQKLVGKSFKIDKKPLTTYKAPRHIK